MLRNVEDPLQATYKGDPRFTDTAWERLLPTVPRTRTNRSLSVRRVPHTTLRHCVLNSIPYFFENVNKFSRKSSVDVRFVNPSFEKSVSENRCCTDFSP